MNTSANSSSLSALKMAMNISRINNTLDFGPGKRLQITGLQGSKGNVKLQTLSSNQQCCSIICLCIRCRTKQPDSLCPNCITIFCLENMAEISKTLCSNSSHVCMWYINPSKCKRKSKLQIGYLNNK